MHLILILNKFNNKPIYYTRILKGIIQGKIYIHKTENFFKNI